MNTQPKELNIKRMMILLLVISAIVRGVLAMWMELGNDEVYYWTYALYPDWSHFDHPPMVGWVIQLFTLNLLLDSEFFLRLASVVFMTANTYVIFRLSKDLKDATTGLYAALLYTASIYAFVITGIFIMPDTPLMLFWLLAIWMAIRYFSELPHFKSNDADNANTHHANATGHDKAIYKKKALRPFTGPQQPSQLILFGAFAGLAMLSKYSGIFLWVGIGFYILIFNRKQLKNPYLYLSLLISIICCLPILYWNLKYDLVSFSFHSQRVGGGSLNFGTLGTELAGEFLYNNPVVVVSTIIAVIAALNKRVNMGETSQRLILCVALPMIVVFWAFSLTRPTLPHWNAPAFAILIPLVAVWLQDKNTGSRKVPRSITSALAVLLFTLLIGVAEIKTGFVPLDKHTEPTQLGRDDFTLDMYGWRQLGEKFADFREQKIAEGVTSKEAGIVANQWFPLANLDYYVARPLGMRVMGLGWPDFLHKYLWINDERGGFHLGEDFWFLTDSRYLKDPQETYQWYFKKIELVGTIEIERCGQPAKNVFVYTCKCLTDLPPTLQDFMAQSAAKDK